MKKIILLAALSIVFTLKNQAQVINCGGFCVSNIALDTLTNSMNVTITTSASSGQVNYPSIMVVNNVGDTIANINQAYYYFAQLPSTTLVHNIPTTDTTVLMGLPYTIYLKDNIYFNGCIFNYPMTCFVGIDEAVAENNSLDIFPNPATSTINIAVGETHEQPALINLYNDKGQLIKTITTTTANTTINTEGLSDGIYFVTVDMNGRRLKSKLVIDNH